MADFVEQNFKGPRRFTEGIGRLGGVGTNDVLPWHRRGSPGSSCGLPTSQLVMGLPVLSVQRCARITRLDVGMPQPTDAMRGTPWSTLKWTEWWQSTKWGGDRGESLNWAPLTTSHPVQVGIILVAGNPKKVLCGSSDPLYNFRLIRHFAVRQMHTQIYGCGYKLAFQRIH